MMPGVRGESRTPLLTGPGTPTEASPDASEERAEPPSPARLRAVSQPRRNHRRRSAVRKPAKTATVEPQARAVYTPGMTVEQLQKAARISRNSASKWCKILIAEGLDEPQEGIAV